MTFQEAERQYKDFAAEHAANKLTDADFEAKVNELRIQDTQGRWWQIGVQSGDWYVNDGQKWSKATPPLEAAPVSAVAQETGATESGRPSMPPRQIFSSKPAGRGNGGLSRPAFIGIIAGVALLGLALIVGGYVLLSGPLKLGGTTPTARATATQVALAIPTQPIAQPTQPPVVQPTQPLQPTAVVTATVPAGPTNTRPPAPTRTPTRVAPAGPTNTPTISAPPGLYVSNTVPEPAVPNFLPETVGFKVTFFNSTGGAASREFKVKVYQAQSELTRSIGETRSSILNVSPGASSHSLERTWGSGPGVCDFVAEVFYLDAGVSGQWLPLSKPDGKRGVFNFKMAC